MMAVRHLEIKSRCYRKPGFIQIEIGKVFKRRNSFTFTETGIVIIDLIFYFNAVAAKCKVIISELCKPCFEAVIIDLRA